MENESFERKKECYLDTLNLDAPSTLPKGEEGAESGSSPINLPPQLDTLLPDSGVEYINSTTTKVAFHKFWVH